ncbi:hypothetical protein DD237_001781 [Peronospora effusa]|uniref:START domain-containing protein n=1 Tax=Peronospora effusa TaxID=542832 RepID=A0A425CNH1_9STRA|nr:hypothetical protein DD237_001781 [Peronospora effusa]
MTSQYTTRRNGSMAFSARSSASVTTSTHVTTSRNYRPLGVDSIGIGPLPPLILSVEEADQLEHLAHSVMKQTLTDYLHFREVRKRRLLDEQWKEVRRHENLVAFKERDSWRQQHQTLSTPDGRLEPVISKTSVPTVLVLGSLQGTLDDEMYGMHIDSDNAAKLRSSYIHDQVHDFRLLTRIRGATKDDPFRFCGVTWADLGHTGYGPFAKKRDCCVVMSMGVTTTGRKERIGYYVVHSVGVTLNGPMGRSTQLGLESSTNTTCNYIRAKSSMCWLKCELPNGNVELYMQGFFAPMGSIPEFAVVNAALTAAFGLAQTSDTAYSKKIRWMLHDSVRSTRRLVSLSAENCVGRCKPYFGVTKKRKLGCCFICRAWVTSDVSLQCICMPRIQLVCSSCRTIRKVTMDVAADSVVQQTRCCICLLCMAYAKQISAEVFAVREMAMSRTRNYPTLST